MPCLIGCYRLLNLYTITANVITRSSKQALICFTRLKDCIFALECTGLRRRNSGAERQQALGTAAMTLDVESRVTRGSSLEAEEGWDAGDAVESRHLGGLCRQARFLYKFSRNHTNISC